MNGAATLSAPGPRFGPLSGLALGLLLALPVRAACPPAASDGRLLTQGDVRLAWRAEREAEPPLVIGELFTLRVQVCPAEALLLRVDASMPEHRHGMNYRPRIDALGGGRYRVEGLMWHMAGRWEWVFELAAPTGDVRLTDSLRLL